MSFPRYPKYKASGLDWMAEVPEHWGVTKMKWIATMESGHTPDKKVPEYWDNEGIPWVSLNDTGYLKDNDYISDTAYKISELGIANSSARLLPPRVVVFSRDATIGRCAITTRPMAVSQHFIAWVCGKSIVPEYLLLRLRSMTQELDRLTTGATLKTIGMPEVRTLLTPVPPLEEQTQIANYLARETKKLDDLVEGQRRLIELLKEKRQAEIFHAVTKGLTPNVPRKPSGVEWLGDVPEHWTVIPIKRVATLESGHTPSRQHPEYWEDCTVPWFTLADVWQIREARAEYIYDTKEKVSELGLSNSSARLLPQHTVILSRTASVGFSAIMGVPMATTQDFANWVCGPRLQPEFLLYVLRSMEGEFRRLMMGSTHNTIYMPDIQSLRLALPPRAEQLAIVGHVRVKSAECETLIGQAQHAIDLLQERRAALISAAVNGQIDVRAMSGKQSA
jgi:type I restriction enzyme S subunit